MNALLEKPETIVPTKEDAELATESSRILAKTKPKESFKVRLESGDILVLPAAVYQLLSHLLTEMSRGNAVTLIPLHAELTTQEAADYLNISRPFLIKLIEQSKIPHRMVGTHRRVKFVDLETFRRESETASDAVLKELAEEAQKLNMGY